MEDEAGKRIAYANSLFSLIDIETAHPMRPTEEMLEKYVLGEKIPMDYAPRKITIPDGAVKGEEILILPHHLDVNHHVNNGQYVRMAVNVLPVGYEVSELRAEFRLAAKMGDTLYIRTARDDEHFYVVLTDADENPYFLCEFSGSVKA